MSSAYCTRANLEVHYGAENIRAWADLNNRLTASEITARIEEAIADASEEMNDRLRGGIYSVPFDDAPSCPNAIKRICVLLAAFELYNARGSQDFDQEGEAVTKLSGDRTRAIKLIDEINSGRLKLGNEEYDDAPSIVAVETPSQTDDTIDETENWE